MKMFARIKENLNHAREQGIKRCGYDLVALMSDGWFFPLVSLEQGECKRLLNEKDQAVQELEKEYKSYSLLQKIAYHMGYDSVVRKSAKLKEE